MKAREPRLKVMLRARLRGPAGWSDACILNLSSHGLLIQAATPPMRGCYVEIHRGHNLIIARVAWHKGHRCGLRTQDALAIDALVAEAPQGAVATAEASPTIERRARPRPVEIRHERSRERARAIEFAGLALFGMLAAGMAFSVVQSSLAAPLARVSQALEPHSGG